MQGQMQALARLADLEARVGAAELAFAEAPGRDGALRIHARCGPLWAELMGAHRAGVQDGSWRAASALMARLTAALMQAGR